MAFSKIYPLFVTVTSVYFGTFTLAAAREGYKALFGLPSHGGNIYLLPFYIFAAGVCVVLLKTVPGVKVWETPCSDNTDIQKSSQLLTFQFITMSILATMLTVIILDTRADLDMPIRLSGFLPGVAQIMIILMHWWSQKLSDKRRKIFPVYIADYLFVLPFIIMVLVCSGGPSSPYKFILIPFIITSALKPSKVYILVSSAVSFLTLILIRLFMPAGSPFDGINIDIGYTAVFLIMLAFEVYYFKTGELIKKRLTESAPVDNLTGLFRFRDIQSLLEELLKQQPNYSFSILIDIENFMYVNEKLGHLAGDELLKQVAAYLKGAVRANDFVARFGGDEFIIVPANITNRQQARELAERLKKGVHNVCSHFVTEYCLNTPSPGYITASVKISRTSELAETVNQFAQRVDEALCKLNGKSIAKSHN